MNPEGLPLVTVAVPVLNDAHYLEGLVSAILDQTYPADRLQVILADGGSDDGADHIARQAAQRYPQVSFLHNPGISPASALNLVLRQAEGEIFIRLDARTRPAPDYIEQAVACLQATGATGVAGPQVADGETEQARVHALALNHPFGSGKPAYRRARKPTPSETLYLGAYRTQALVAIGGWDEVFLANEDYELNTRLRQGGGTLIVDPAIRSRYLVRKDLLDLGRQYARYGAWRTVTLRHHANAWRLRHAAPAFLVLVLFLALLITPASQLPLVVAGSLYGGMVILVSTYLTLRSQLRDWPRLVATFVTIHLSWGVAFWWAWLRPPQSQRPAR